MFIHRLRKSGAGACMKRGGKLPLVKSTRRITGKGIVQEVFEPSLLKPTEILRNIKVVKSRMPKKYITFE
jgi:hypothetical protein